jgi:hypothetical protein
MSVAANTLLVLSVVFAVFSVGGALLERRAPDQGKRKEGVRVLSSLEKFERTAQSKWDFQELLSELRHLDLSYYAADPEFRTKLNAVLVRLAPPDTGAQPGGRPS